MGERLAGVGLLVTVGAIAYDMGARICAQAGAGPGGIDLVAGLLVLVAILVVLGVGLLLLSRLPSGDLPSEEGTTTPSRKAGRP